MGLIPAALHVEQTAIDECMRLRAGKSCNATRCESISWSPTLPDNSDVPERRYAAKQHLVLSIWGTRKGDLERGTLKQRPMLDITRSNQNQVRAHVCKVKSYLIQSARDKIAELHDLHCFESNAECLESIDSLLADSKYRFAVAEGVEGGVCGPNQMQRESKAAIEWPASASLPVRSNPTVYLHQFLPLGESPQ